MRISCCVDDCIHDGDVEFELRQESLIVESFRLMSESQIVCSNTQSKDQTESISIVGKLFGKRVGESFMLRLCLQPLETILNALPIPIQISTKIPHMFCKDSKSEKGDFIHGLNSGESLLVCSSTKSIVFKIGFVAEAMDGAPYGSTADIEFQPLVNKRPKVTWHPLQNIQNPDRGPQKIFIAHGMEGLSLANQNNAEDPRHLDQATEWMERTDPIRSYVSSQSILVDHTNSCLAMCPSKSFSVFPILGGDKSAKRKDSPFGAYESNQYEGRVSLLPATEDEIQLLRTLVDATGTKVSKKSERFKIEEVSICGGGLASSKLCWENGQASGLFLYRTLSNYIQTELHVVPEVAVFNASKKYEIEVQQTNHPVILVPPGETKGLEKDERDLSIVVSWNGLRGARTAPVKVNELGLRVVVVRRADGAAIGSVVIQTTGGSVDSYIVVKVGTVHIGSQAQELFNSSNKEELLPRDALRARLQLSSLQISLIPASKGRILDSKTVLIANSSSTQEFELSTLSSRDQKLCILRMEQVTMDVQRVWKEKRQMTQFSFIIHNLQLTDEMPSTKMPVVFKSNGPSRFFDLTIVCSGPLLRTMVTVESLDLKLADNSGKSEKICLSASEAFLLNLVKVLDKMKHASNALESHDAISLELDEQQNLYRLKREEGLGLATAKRTHQYSPPGSERLFDVHAIRISPIFLVFSFEHSPEVLSMSSRSNGEYQNMLSYLAQRLKVKIQEADLRFSKFERTTSSRGPADKFLGVLVSFYIAQLKYQVLSVLAASNVKLNKKQITRNS